MNKKIDMGSFEDLLRMVEGGSKRVDVSQEQNIIRRAESDLAAKKSSKSWSEKVVSARTKTPTSLER